MLAVLLAAMLLPLASAFAVGAPSALAMQAKPATVTMGMFDGFSKAFDNDKSLGARKSAGLSKEKGKRTVTWIGPNGQKKQATVVPGQALKNIARGCGIPIRYDCQEGTCKTCEAMVGGGRAKICVARMVRPPPHGPGPPSHLTAKRCAPRNRPAAPRRTHNSR